MLEPKQMRYHPHLKLAWYISTSCSFLHLQVSHLSGIYVLVLTWVEKTQLIHIFVQRTMGRLYMCTCFYATINLSSSSTATVHMPHSGSSAKWQSSLHTDNL